MVTRSDVPQWTVCRHCSKCKVNRPRGLCWSCYYTPGVKEQYPSTSKYARREVGNFNGNAPLPEPTAAAPGTAEKMAVLEQRAAAGEQLFHPDDATLDGTQTPAPHQGRPRGKHLPNVPWVRLRRLVLAGARRMPDDE